MEPYYEDEYVTLYHGDAADLLAVITGASVAITDPPYGFGAYVTDKEASRDVLASCLTLRTTAVFGYPELLVKWCLAVGRVPDEWVTWWPTNSKSRAYGKGLARESEHVAIFGSVHGDRIMRRRSLNEWARTVTANRGLDPDWCRDGDVWRDHTPRPGSIGGRLHANEKPLPLMSRLVLLCSDAGETVADPYSGSGTTLVAAKQLGRRAIGVEIDEAHCETAAKRLTQDTLFGGAA